MHPCLPTVFWPVNHIEKVGLFQVYYTKMTSINDFRFICSFKQVCTSAKTNDMETNDPNGLPMAEEISWIDFLEKSPTVIERNQQRPVEALQIKLINGFFDNERLLSWKEAVAFVTFLKRISSWVPERDSDRPNEFETNRFLLVDFLNKDTVEIIMLKNVHVSINLKAKCLVSVWIKVKGIVPLSTTRHMIFCDWKISIHFGISAKNFSKYLKKFYRIMRNLLIFDIQFLFSCFKVEDSSYKNFANAVSYNYKSLPFLRI